MLSDQIGPLRSYAGNYFSGSANGYVEAHFGEGSPDSLNATYQWGAFGGFFLNQVNATVARQIRRRLSASLDVAGTRERPFGTGSADGQWLRRLSHALPFGSDQNASLSYRVISGRGGFALPGRNVAVSFRKRFRDGGELFSNYGTPSASNSLDRLIVKYLIRINGGL